MSAYQMIVSDIARELEWDGALHGLLAAVARVADPEQILAFFVGDLGRPAL